MGSAERKILSFFRGILNFFAKKARIGVSGFRRKRDLYKPLPTDMAQFLPSLNSPKVVARNSLEKTKQFSEEVRATSMNRWTLEIVLHSSPSKNLSSQLLQH